MLGQLFSYISPKLSDISLNKCIFMHMFTFCCTFGLKQFTCLIDAELGGCLLCIYRPFVGKPMGRF